MEKEGKSVIHITNNFNAPIGQHIDHVDTIHFSMDGDGTFHFGMVERMDQKPAGLSLERLARAIENSQEMFWANSAYAVVYCLCRDDFGWNMSQTAFEQRVEQLPYQKKRDYKCPKGTIANAMSDNAVYRLPCGRWQQAGAPQRVMKLLGRLRSELKL